MYLQESGEHKHQFDDHYRETALFHHFTTSTLPMSDGTKGYTLRGTTKVGDHTHSGATDDVGKSNPFDNRPAYHKLAFIMRIE